MKITLHNRTPPVSIDCEGYAAVLPRAVAHRINMLAEAL